MSFVQQRERRANAGNRMRALLDQEADMEELFEMDESEDEAFSAAEEEEAVDTVDSDFDLDESEGEEEQEQLAEEEEKRIRQAERQSRRPQHMEFLKKPSRSNIPSSKTKDTTQKAIKRVTDTTGRPTRKEDRDTRQQLPRQQRQQQQADFSNRQSLRAKTILNRIYVEEQLRENEIRKTLIPKRSRPKEIRLTQEELLAEAKLTEEQNLASLEQWQQKEAERQSKAKIKVKRGIDEPFIRYHSFTDSTTKERPLQRKLIMIVDDEEGNTSQKEITDPAALEFQFRRDVEESDLAARNLITFYSADDITREHQELAADKEADENSQKKIINRLQHIKTEGLTDKELDRLDIVPQLRSWTARPSRPIRPLPCPITGKEAHYREPITQTPYANAACYTTIKDCLEHKYIWAPSLGIYIGKESGSKGAEGVPDGWDRMILGKRPGEEDWPSPVPSWMETKTELTASTPPPSQSDDQQQDTKRKTRLRRG